MKTLGIVAEYNPFHNGHKYHLEKSKEVCGASHIVCVMSGSFVQRGEFAIFNKWERAKNAILNGVDLVLELPTYYVLQSAQNFAFGAVMLLDSLNAVDLISFGSETDDLSKLSKISKIIDGTNEEYNTYFKKAIESGVGYPVARNIALEKMANFDEKILTPNNLLGIYYLEALNKLNSNIKPFCVKRNKTLHNKIEENADFATASHIRKIIKGSNLKTAGEFLPQNSRYENAFYAENISDYILGFLRFSSLSDDIIGAEKGMAKYITECAKTSKTLDEFYENCATKRYTKSRVKRVVLASLIGMNIEAEMDYVRVLGFNEKGAELLKKIKKKCNFPLVVKTADFIPPKSSMFKYDILSTDLAYFSRAEKEAGMDYKTSPVIIK